MTTTATEQLPAGFEVRLRDGPDPCRRRPAPRRRLTGARRAAQRPRRRPCSATGRVTVTDAASAHLADRLLDANLADPVLDDIERRAARPDRRRPGPRPGRAARPLPRGTRTAAVHRRRRRVGGPGAGRRGRRAARRHVVVSLDRNLGPAGARNAGLAAVTTPLRRLRRLRRRGRRRPTCSTWPGTSPTRRSPSSGPRSSAVARTERPALVRAVRRRRLLARPSAPTRHRSDRAPRSPGCRSACLVGTRRPARRAASTRPCGSARTSTWSGASIAAGTACATTRRSTASHDVRPTVRGWLGRKFVYGTGGAALAARHGDKLAPAVLSPSRPRSAPPRSCSAAGGRCPVAAVAVATTTRLAPQPPDGVAVDHAGRRGSPPGASAGRSARSPACCCGTGGPLAAARRALQQHRTTRRGDRHDRRPRSCSCGAPGRRPGHGAGRPTRRRPRLRLRTLVGSSLAVEAFAVCSSVGRTSRTPAHRGPHRRDASGPGWSQTVVQVTRTPPVPGVEQAIVPPALRIVARSEARASLGTVAVCQVMTPVRSSSPCCPASPCRAAGGRSGSR